MMVNQDHDFNLAAQRAFQCSHRFCEFSQRSSQAIRSLRAICFESAGGEPAGGGYFFREVFDSEMHSDGETAGQEQEKREQKIFCRACGNAVTDRRNRVAVQGKHQHTFFNPAGIVYELGCFSAAPGCRVAGEASAEFSWFAGYVWRVGLCSKCLTHIGWQFQGVEDQFYGLIVTCLQERER